ncbi:hypothetical protein PIB30_063414 [Stylosanthes scabra]|uniref:Uncharacterized protein n=1 Tax=Stylosanthes scabra TaxID=79078 RepID=A0ABU6SLE2_9FABA|nr:hypothetical protein [Stylosanthes scabra]
MEPPMDHPLAKYFSRLDDLNNYLVNSAERKIIQPRYLDINLLDTQNFNTLSTILNDQGLIEFVQIQDTYYPELVAIAYSTLSLVSNEEKFTLKFRLNKSEYGIDSNTLENIWDLDKVDTIDCCLFDGSKTPENWGAHVKRSALEIFNIQRAPKKKILCTIFNAEMRVLHYLINYTIMPRSSGHGHVLVDDLVSMFTKSDYSKGLGYVCLWTRIFKHLGIDLDGESGRWLTQQNCIDIRTLHHMGRGIEEQEDQEPPQEQAHQEQAGPSEQPSMRDLMQVLQRIEQNQESMNNRFQRFEET